MTIKAIQSLQAVQQEHNVESQTTARDKMQSAEAQQKAISDEQYKDQIAEMVNQKQAADTKSEATCWFAIFLGPLIGTAIGNAVGGGLAKGDEEDAAEFKKQVGLDDLASQKADDEFSKARKNFQDASKDGQDLAKFTRELRDDKWTGL